MSQEENKFKSGIIISENIVFSYFRSISAIGLFACVRAAKIIQSPGFTKVGKNRKNRDLNLK